MSNELDEILAATGKLGDAMESAGCSLQMIAKGYILTACSLIVQDRYGDSLGDTQHADMSTRLAVHLIESAREFAKREQATN